MEDERHALRERLRRAAAGALYERRWGADTSEHASLEDLGLGETEERNHYEPSEWRALRRMLRPREVGEDDVFIDFGSGKGRAVLRAAQYPFRRVVGVELSEELTEVARHNLERNRHHLRVQDVELVTADVLEYEIPDDLTVVYFNNPFTGSLFGAVLARLLESLDRRPRRMRVLYRNPVEHEQIMASGRAKVLRRCQRDALWGRPRGVLMHVYELLPAPPDP
jgi:hypothetical protein